uniref:AlNc14C24G2393 protein n=1 Tax=Albugo laibachii Nc14 TaxID=890382 RepID=F0W693_9STRA|nr:AlNc14C24G2393 [Albugo laibachii Nc14]|eukprot:CCA16636.1 AlNc14C24G2393 [Albugo laibachii Nc14]
MDDGWPTSAGVSTGVTRSHDSTLSMEIMWSLGLYVFFRYLEFCAGESQSLRLITYRTALKECQSCLLKYLSVIHMEELKPSDGSYAALVE